MRYRVGGADSGVNDSGLKALNGRFRPWAPTHCDRLLTFPAEEFHEQPTM